MIVTAVAVVALLVALLALALALLAWRKADDAQHDAHTHPKPPRERREVNLGAPRATGERRGAHRPPEPDDDPDATGMLPAVELPTAAIAAQPSGRANLPPPGSIRG